MGHDSGHAAHDAAQNPRLVFMTLALFFAMSAVGHYVFVMRDSHEAVSKHTAVPHEEATPAVTEKETHPQPAARKPKKH